MAFRRAHLDYILRVIESLRGILAGIATDSRLSDREIAGLRSWMDKHENLHQMYPFSELMNILEKSLMDHVIDDDEREDILGWCRDFSDPYSTPMEYIKQKIQNLHGFLQGLAIDKRITDGEIHGLREWIDDHEELRGTWPFCDVWEIVKNILADGVITPREKQDFLQYCQSFAEIPIDSPIFHGQDDHDRFTNWAPVLRPISALYEEVKVALPGKEICFTGLLKTGTRNQVLEMAEKAGAIPRRNVVLSLNFLVIGAQSSPCWAFATYGRKVEKALEYKRKGQPIAIVSEDTFLQAHGRI